MTKPSDLFFESNDAAAQGTDQRHGLVFFQRRDLKVVRPVVVADAVQVVDVFMALKRSAKNLFHHIAVFKNSFTLAARSQSWTEPDIAIVVDDSTAKPRRVIFSGWIRVVLALTQLYARSLEPLKYVAGCASEALCNLNGRQSLVVEGDDVVYGEPDTLAVSWPVTIIFHGQIISVKLAAGMAKYASPAHVFVE